MARTINGKWSRLPKTLHPVSLDVISRVFRVVALSVFLLYMWMKFAEEVIEANSQGDETLLSKGVVSSQQDLTVESSQSHSPRWAWNTTTLPLHHGSKHACLSSDVPALSEEWQLRAPHFVILGTQKGGTQALQSYLIRHPQVSSSKPITKHFFDVNFDTYATNEGIRLKEAREAYDELFHSIHKAALKGKRQYYGMDSTPAYLFHSDRIPSRLLCIAPWAKLIVVLRHPVDRAYSHYTMHGSYSDEVLSGKSFEHYVETDMAKLKAAGVVREWANDDEFRSFSGSREELQAWEAYIDSLDEKRSKSYIGRGLYAIQLRHWKKAMEDIGKPSSDLLIVHSDDMKHDTSAVFHKIQRFLGLQEIELSNYSVRHSGSYDKPLSDEMRRRLEAFYAPYNRQLYDMLGGEWEGVWDRV